MNKRHPYNSIIERKLEQLPVADTDRLWADMHSILDKKMPQKKERRRFIGWLFSGKGLLLLNLIFFITGAVLFVLSAKNNADNTITNLSNIQLINKTNEDSITKTNPVQQENVTVSVPHQIDRSAPTTPKVLAAGFERTVNNRYIAQKKLTTDYNKYSIQDESSVHMQAISKNRTNFEIVPVDLNSINQDFHITTSHNKKIDSLINEAGLLNNNAKKNQGNNHRQGFYAGIISGFDLSSVRFRSLRAGSSKGFVIGYSLNEKWSIESGLLWDSKRVSDDGNNFTPPGYTPSGGITITAVNGKNRLYEWPINLKYSMLTGKHGLFATTGVSSYFMRSENYDYAYMQNSQPAGHNYLSYKNATQNWFAVINFSTGYTHRLGEIGSLRVEPYLKLPVKDLGVGKMPIVSTGLNVGFTKSIK